MVKTPRILFPAPALLAVLAILLLQSRIMAQPNIVRAATDGNGVPVTKSDADLAHKLDALEEQIRAQGARIDQLTALITEQQRLIAQLTRNSTTASVIAASEIEKSTPPAAASGPVPAEAQTPSVEDRVKKLEETVRRFGPFRFSGDFRLRFDATLRRAEPNPPPGFAPLTHAQNMRARYRLRLNFDTDINPKLSFHGQLSTGLLNVPTGSDQDFAQTAVKHAFTLSEAWIDYHPNKSLQLLAGRLPEIFADNSRFMFDDDIRFNGFNEKYVIAFDKNSLNFSSLELRAGQYILSNPNVAIVTSGSPLAQAGAVIGSTGRSANLFDQGVLVNQKYNDRWSSQWGGNLQLYRNPNQIQLASTANGVALIVQNGVGITLSGPIAGTGNATTTAGGAIYTAPSFKIARVTWRLNWAGFRSGGRDYPVIFNIQAARNIGIGLPERDALMAALQLGRTVKRGDMAFYYVFFVKGANAMISQFTDDDVGTGTGVNIRTHHLRFDYALSRNVTWQSLLYLQNELRNSGQFANFFVPLNGFTPRQYRWQEQLVFTF